MGLTRSFAVNMDGVKELAAIVAPAIAALQDVTNIGPDMLTPLRRTTRQSRQAAANATGMTETRFGALEGGQTPTVEELSALLAWVEASTDAEGNPVAPEVEETPDAKPKRKTKASEAKPDLSIVEGSTEEESPDEDESNDPSEDDDWD